MLNHVPDTWSDYFRGFVFQVHRDGPDLYKKTIDQLALYASMQFKNGFCA